MSFLINQLRPFILATISFSLLISGCSRSSDISKEIPTSTMAVTKTSDIPAFQSPTTIATPSCKSSIISINKLLNGKNIVSYQWSENEEYLYVQTSDEWWQYTIEDQELLPFLDPKTIAAKTPPVVENLYRIILGNEFDSLKYWSALSPDGTSLVYWDTPDRLILPTNTPNPDLIANENYKDVGEMEVFLLEDTFPEPIYLGEVPGIIKKGIWFQDNERLVLEISQFQPYYLWLVDTSARSLTPILSEEEVSSAPKFALLDVSPDGNWAMYQSSLVDYVSIVNVNDLSVVALHDLPRNMGAWWLSDGERIVAVAATKTNVYSILLYDMKKKAIIETLLNVERGGNFQLLGASDKELRLVHVNNDYQKPIVIDLLTICLPP